METAPWEELAQSFLETRAEAESFAVSDLTAFVASNFGGQTQETDRQRLSRQIEIFLEDNTSLFYRAGDERCWRRGAFSRAPSSRSVPPRWRSAKVCSFTAPGSLRSVPRRFLPTNTISRTPDPT